jgi:dipeptidase D
MSELIRQLQPSALWNHFADLNSIPRASKKEERVIAFAKAFGETLGLPTYVDEVGNVIIKKAATQGMENRATVCLQSHLDMVHQKNADTSFDFDTQGIEMYIDEDWVRARGTTLGADNGIGVAAIMALLSSTDIPHPPLEALFTIDEETGMTGAMGLKGGLLDASIMLNLDTEEDNELTIGCAGGIDVTANGTYEQVQTPEGAVAFQVVLKGLTGGHSGMDIHRGRGNANKLMNRFLYQAITTCGVSIANIAGGSLRNAIPRESHAVLCLDAANKSKLLELVAEYNTLYASEYKTTDPNLSLSAKPADLPSKVMQNAFALSFVQVMYGAPNGIYRMSPDIDGLVQTSNNIARVVVGEGAYSVQCLTRSAVDSEKMDLANALSALFGIWGASISFGGSYPGWTPKPDASIVKIMRELYAQLHPGEQPHVNACHAGLECGILGTNYPNMEMISFGPTIQGAHSPDERVSISSVGKFWSYLLATLKHIPVQA